MATTLITVPIDSLIPNPDQPRLEINDSELLSLTQSIKEKGIIHPPVVEPIDDENYFIVDGERRWRAAKLANMKKIAVIIHTSKKVAGDYLERALIANLHSRIQ